MAEKQTPSKELKNTGYLANLSLSPAKKEFKPEQTQSTLEDAQARLESFKQLQTSRKRRTQPCANAWMSSKSTSSLDYPEI